MKFDSRLVSISAKSSRSVPNRQVAIAVASFDVQSQIIKQGFLMDEQQATQTAGDRNGRDAYRRSSPRAGK